VGGGGRDERAKGRGGESSDLSVFGRRALASPDTPVSCSASSASSAGERGILQRDKNDYATNCDVRAGGGEPVFAGCRLIG